MQKNQIRKGLWPILWAERCFWRCLSVIAVSLGLVACASDPDTGCLDSKGGEGGRTVQTAHVKPLQTSSWQELPGWQNDRILEAWPAWLLSCKALRGKKDWPKWQSVCDAASRLRPGNEASARQFFEARFIPFKVVNTEGDSHGMMTGYYEPLLHGARQKGGKYQYPLLAEPEDLVTVDLSSVNDKVKNLRLRGRLVGKKLVPYYDRAQIEQRLRLGAMKAKVLFWVDDPVELFFLQVQGSGRIQLADGSMARVGYANQNGYPYQSIGRWLVANNEMTLDEASMQGIKDWVDRNPARVQSLFNQNPSYVFFQDSSVKGKGADGPLGALGMPLTAGRSIAVDPSMIPLGAPVMLRSSFPGASEQALERLVMAQDTGGAIRGAVRADYFWGFGSDAAQFAGRTRQDLEMWVLLPQGYF